MNTTDLGLEICQTEKDTKSGSKKDKSLVNLLDNSSQEKRMDMVNSSRKINGFITVPLQIIK